MSRYIDADKLHDEVDMFCRNVRSEKIHKSGIHAMIENIPTADVVEVVRCRDCKWHHLSTCYRPMYGEDFSETGYMYPIEADVKDTDFCSYGERKDGAE